MPAEDQEAVAALLPLIRRVASARLREPQAVDDVVQETMARLLAAADRLEAHALAPYAVVIARNLVVSRWQSEERSRRYAPRMLDPTSPTPPDEEVLRREVGATVTGALAELTSREREALLAHEVEGTATATLARAWGSSPAAVAAQLARARARLRVEYLLSEDGTPPPTDRCRPVLLSLSAGDRRRQGELDAGRHLLECDLCARLSPPLLERRPTTGPDETLVPVSRDADVVTARQRARDVAQTLWFSPTDLTLIATAVSEVTRNIVRFAKRGEILLRTVEVDGRRGLTIVARDAGPGIRDVSLAVQDGYSTYGGLGLGLPGCRRLMDEFAVLSEVDRGTTVTMTKWCP